MQVIGNTSIILNPRRLFRSRKRPVHSASPWCTQCPWKGSDGTGHQATEVCFNGGPEPPRGHGGDCNELAAAVFRLETIPPHRGRFTANRAAQVGTHAAPDGAGTASSSDVGWEYGVVARTGVKRAKTPCHRAGAQPEKMLDNSVRLKPSNHLTNMPTGESGAARFSALIPFTVPDLGGK